MDMNTQDKQETNNDYTYSNDNPKWREPQAAKYIGIGHSTLKLWRTQGIGPVYERLSRNMIYYYKRDLDEFLRKRKHPENPSIFAFTSVAGLEQDIP